MLKFDVLFKCVWICNLLSIGFGNILSWVKVRLLILISLFIWMG